MPQERLFVGRKDELARWDKVLNEPHGQAVLVVGHQGMGKSMLANEMAYRAEEHTALTCGVVRYEVGEEVKFDTLIELMMEDAYTAAKHVPGSLELTTQRKKQWKALFDIVKAGDLLASLFQERKQLKKDEFIDKISAISGKLTQNARAIFLIDSDKYMEQGCEDQWNYVIRNLPDKVKLIFAQRREDVLAECHETQRLDNCVRIEIESFNEAEYAYLINKYSLNLAIPEVRLAEALKRYNGHPYCVVAVLDLVKAGRSLENLPPDPKGIAEEQWEKIKRGGDGKWDKDKAVRLFNAYAVLDVSVPGEVATHVAGIDSVERDILLAAPYIGKLIEKKGDGRQIYHSIIADYIRSQLSENEAKPYHERAVEKYRQMLKEAKEKSIRPEPIAALGLPSHLLKLGDTKTFVTTFTNECCKPLVNIGLLDAAIDLSERALQFVTDNSHEQAAIFGILGIIYQKRGELDRAEEMQLKSLEINKQLGSLEGMATQYGNLGLIYLTRGELDRAEDMLLKSLEIDKQLGHLEGMANQYGNLGIIYLTRGELDRAEDMLLKSLEIEKKLGRLEGIAIQYGNLGSIAKERGDIAKARELWTKARDLYEQIGIIPDVTKVQGWLDSLS